MHDAPHTTETERLADLQSYDILDSQAEAAYDALTELAAGTFGVPTALVSLVDNGRQWFKSRVGLDSQQTDRSSSFCAHAILDPAHVLIVEDATLDERFATNPLVTGPPNIRFYAGAPIISSSGFALGTVCVIDTKPRHPDSTQVRALQLLAMQAAALLELRKRTKEAEQATRDRDAIAATAQKDRRESEDLLQLVLRGGDLGLWDLDPLAGTWSINARESEIVGHAPGIDSEGLDWNSLIHPDDVCKQRSAFHIHRRGETPYAESTYRMRHKDGHWVWVLDRSVIVERDDTGRARRIVGTHMDITLQVERENERLRSSERLELALNAGGLGLWDLDVPLGRASYSDRWWALFGYRPDEVAVVDGLWTSMVHPDDEARARDALRHHLTGAAAGYEAEVRMRHKDGQWRWISDRATVVERSSDGHALRVVGVASDISTRKAAEAALAFERHRLQMITDHLPALITHVDRNERYTFASAHHERVFGFRPAALLGKTMREACGPEIYSRIAQHIARALAGHAVRFEDAGPARGAIIEYESNYIPDVDADGVVTGFFAMVFDITERRTAQRELLAQQQRLKGITDNVPALIAELDSEMRFTFANATYTEWLGIDSVAMIGKTLAETIGESLFEPRRAYLARAYGGEQTSFDQAVQLPSGERCLQTTYIPQLRPDGSVKGLYALTSDISELKETQTQLAALARQDALTGLPNRRVFEERLYEAVARNDRADNSLALLFLDLDRFKSINDTSGHADGDAVLRELSRRLLANVRKTDLVARLAGDEFVILLERVEAKRGATTVAKKIIAAMTVPIATERNTHDASVSIGIAVHPGDAKDAAALLGAADAALYQAKRAGRNRYFVAGT